ncbi:MAG: G5 domain-containing protein, partial [Lachnospiraceae bacterium]
ELGGGYLTLNIYGKETRATSRSLQFVSEIIERKEPEGKKFKAEPEMEAGTIETASQGYTGIVAKLWKIICENGTEVSREEVNSSIYEAVKPIVKVGIKSDSAETVSMIETAINSQNEENIKKAAANALNPAPAPANSAPANLAPANPAPANPAPANPTP